MEKEIIYNGRTVWLMLGVSLDPPFRAHLPIRRWGTIILIGKPRQFKSALAKHIAVMVSKFRKMFVFDYNGEWSRHVTKYNFKAKYPGIILNPFIAADFTFPITAFDSSDAFASFGFTPDSCAYLSILAKDGFQYHQNIPSKFFELCMNLPAKADDLEKFNQKYEGYGLSLPMHIDSRTKSSLVTHFNFIKDYLWQGPEDKKKIYDWKKIWLENNHIIVDLTLGTGRRDKNIAMAFCGAILSEIRPIHYITNGFFIFEESHILAPNLKEYETEPSSLIQIRDMVTTLPKQGISCLFICQHENQILQDICEHYHTKIIGVSEPVYNRMEYQIAQSLKWNPDFPPETNGYRELLLWHTERRWCRFVPDITCCKC